MNDVSDDLFAFEGDDDCAVLPSTANVLGLSPASVGPCVDRTGLFDKIKDELDLTWTTGVNTKHIGSTVSCNGRINQSQSVGNGIKTGSVFNSNKSGFVRSNGCVGQSHNNGNIGVKRRVREGSVEGVALLSGTSNNSGVGVTRVLSHGTHSNSSPKTTSTMTNATATQGDVGTSIHGKATSLHPSISDVDVCGLIKANNKRTSNTAIGSMTSPSNRLASAPNCQTSIDTSHKTACSSSPFGGSRKVRARVALHSPINGGNSGVSIRPPIVPRIVTDNVVSRALNKRSNPDEARRVANQPPYVLVRHSGDTFRSKHSSSPIEAYGVAKVRSHHKPIRVEKMKAHSISSASSLDDGSSAYTDYKEGGAVSEERSINSSTPEQLKLARPNNSDFLQAPNRARGESHSQRDLSPSPLSSEGKSDANPLRKSWPTVSSPHTQSSLLPSPVNHGRGLVPGRWPLVWENTFDDASTTSQATTKALNGNTNKRLADAESVIGTNAIVSRQAIDNVVCQDNTLDNNRAGSITGSSVSCDSNSTASSTTSTSDTEDHNHKSVQIPVTANSPNRASSHLPLKRNISANLDMNNLNLNSTRANSALLMANQAILDTTGGELGASLGLVNRRSSVSGIGQSNRSVSSNASNASGFSDLGAAIDGEIVQVSFGMESTSIEPMELVGDDDLVNIGDPESFMGSTYSNPINAHLGSTYSNDLNSHEGSTYSNPTNAQLGGSYSNALNSHEGGTYAHPVNLHEGIVRDLQLLRGEVSEDGFCIGGININYDEQSAGSVSIRARQGSSTGGSRRNATRVNTEGFTTPNSSGSGASTSSSHFDLEMNAYEDQVNDVMRIKHGHDHRPRGEHEPDEYDDDNDSWANDDDILAVDLLPGCGARVLDIKFELGGSEIDGVVAGRGSGLSVTGDNKVMAAKTTSGAPRPSNFMLSKYGAKKTSGKQTAFGHASNRGGKANQRMGVGDNTRFAHGGSVSGKIGGRSMNAGNGTKHNMGGGIIMSVKSESNISSVNSRLGSNQRPSRSIDSFGDELDDGMGCNLTSMGLGSNKRPNINRDGDYSKAHRKMSSSKFATAILLRTSEFLVSCWGTGTFAEIHKPGKLCKGGKIFCKCGCEVLYTATQFLNHAQNKSKRPWRSIFSSEDGRPLGLWREDILKDDPHLGSPCNNININSINHNNISTSIPLTIQKSLSTSSLSMSVKHEPLRNGPTTMTSPFSSARPYSSPSRSSHSSQMGRSNGMINRATTTAMGKPNHLRTNNTYNKVVNRYSNGIASKQGANHTPATPIHKPNLTNLRSTGNYTPNTFNSQPTTTNTATSRGVVGSTDQRRPMSANHIPITSKKHAPTGHISTTTNSTGPRSNIQRPLHETQGRAVGNATLGTQSKSRNVTYSYSTTTATSRTAAVMASQNRTTPTTTSFVYRKSTPTPNNNNNKPSSGAVSARLSTSAIPPSRVPPRTSTAGTVPARSSYVAQPVRRQVNGSTSQSYSSGGVMRPASGPLRSGSTFSSTTPTPTFNSRTTTNTMQSQRVGMNQVQVQRVGVPTKSVIANRSSQTPRQQQQPTSKQQQQQQGPKQQEQQPRQQQQQQQPRQQQRHVPKQQQQQQQHMPRQGLTQSPGANRATSPVVPNLTMAKSDGVVGGAGAKSIA